MEKNREKKKRSPKMIKFIEGLKEACITGLLNLAFGAFMLWILVLILF